MRRRTPVRPAGWPLYSVEGAVTIEAAVAISCLVIVFCLIAGGLVTLAKYISAVDAAGAAARSFAIGVDPPADGAHEVRVSEDRGIVTAVVAVRTPVGRLEAQAQFPDEYR